MSAVAELSMIAAEVELRGHLPECEQHEDDWRECRWCCWAIGVPEITTLLDAQADCRTLLHVEYDRGVAWMVSAAELLRTVDGIDVGHILVPSVRNLAHRLQRMLASDAARLREELRVAGGSGGPVEQRCLLTAGALAAAALQVPSHRDVFRKLPRRIQQRLSGLDKLMSGDGQLRALIPMLDRMHRQRPPALRTQPEWQHLRQPDAPVEAQSAQVRPTGLTPGSLESLVMESVLDEVTSELFDIGSELCDIPGTVRVTRDPGIAISSRTRSLIWRVARIDWHLTFLDSGYATCWGAEHGAGNYTGAAPWQVAVALMVASENDLISATHCDPPTRPPESRLRSEIAPRPALRCELRAWCLDRDA